MNDIEIAATEDSVTMAVSAEDPRTVVQLVMTSEQARQLATALLTKADEVDFPAWRSEKSGAA